MSVVVMEVAAVESIQYPWESNVNEMSKNRSAVAQSRKSIATGAVEQASRRAAFVAALLGAAVACASTASAGIIMSTFDDGAEGWTVNTPSDPAASITWLATGGNPGGHLRFNEPGQGTADFFNAPEKFLGDVSAFVGGELRFDIRLNGNANINANNGVRLIGGGLTLTFDSGQPTTQWTTKFVPLIASEWRINGGANAPTEAQFLSVLSGLDKLNIRADWISGSEQVFLDNVVLVAIPTPATAAALIAFAVARPRRRRR